MVLSQPGVVLCLRLLLFDSEERDNLKNTVGLFIIRNKGLKTPYRYLKEKEKKQQQQKPFIVRPVRPLHTSGPAPSPKLYIAAFPVPVDFTTFIALIKREHFTGHSIA